MKDANSYRNAIHQLIDKISDIRALKRIYQLVTYLYLKEPEN